MLIKAVIQRQAEDAYRLGPKGTWSGTRGSEFPRRGWRTTGRKARPHPGMIEEMNEVTPLSPRKGRLTAKEADEIAEEG